MSGVRRDGLQVLLWDRRDADACVRLERNSLGEEFRITKPAMARILGRMVAEGRMEPLAGKVSGPGTFRVVDPRVYFEKNPPSPDVLRALRGTLEPVREIVDEDYDGEIPKF